MGTGTASELRIATPVPEGLGCRHGVLTFPLPIPKRYKNHPGVGETEQLGAGTGIRTHGAARFVWAPTGIPGFTPPPISPPSSYSLMRGNHPGWAPLHDAHGTPLLVPLAGAAAAAAKGQSPQGSEKRSERSSECNPWILGQRAGSEGSPGCSEMVVYIQLASGHF